MSRPLIRGNSSDYGNVKRSIPIGSRLLESVSVGQVSLKELSSSRHMYIKTNMGDITLITLVNSSASGFAFISEELCHKLNVTSSDLKNPLALVGFEGKPGAQVAKTTSFNLAIGRHQEEMSAFVTPNIKYDLVLGLPWLEKHNQFINWAEHTLTFGENCLNKACCKFETTIPYVNSTDFISTGKMSGPNCTSNHL